VHERAGMGQKLNNLLDFIAESLAQRKGLPIIVSILLIIINYFLQFFPGVGWVAQSNLLLHLGIIIGLIGVMIAWAL
jgi:hypothetical protein